MEQHATQHAAEHAFSILPALPLPGLTPHQAIIVENTWVAMALIIIIVVSVSVSLKRIPGGLQSGIELLVNFIEGYMVDVIGPKGLRYFPLVMTVMMFILFANYIGLVPGFVSPTSSICTTAACAITVFVYYQYVGISRKGLKYFKHFLGPVLPMAPIMLPLEIISEFARPFSLSVRLFANIYAGEMIVKLLFGACAIALPVLWMLVDAGFVMIIQSFIFSLLTMVYLAGAIASDEEH
jgi:F-type H+-transporting ATPase subunit a